MSEFALPPGYRLEPLAKSHPRKRFRSGQPDVDDWLATKALQHQEKLLSVTRVLLDADDAIAGYYTLATGQVDFADLPAEAFYGQNHRTVWLAMQDRTTPTVLELVIGQAITGLVALLAGRGRP